MADSLKEERLKILELLQEGKITPEQAEKLLSALASVDTSAPSSGAPYQFGGIVEPRKPGSKAFRMLKIMVESAGGDHVKINIPVEFAKLLKTAKFSGNDLKGYDIDVDSIIEMVQTGLEGEIVSVDSEDGDHVRIVVE